MMSIPWMKRELRGMRTGGKYPQSIGENVLDISGESSIIKGVGGETLAGATVNGGSIQAGDYPTAFSATKPETKNTQMLFDYVSHLSNPNADTLQLYKLMGKMENIQSQGIPFKISHGRNSSVSAQYYPLTGKYANVTLTIPKLNKDNLIGAANTTLHEEMHLIDLFMRENPNGIGAFTKSQALAGEYINVVKNGDSAMGNEVRALFDDFHKEMDTIRQKAADRKNKRLDTFMKSYYPNGLSSEAIKSDPAKYNDFCVKYLKETKKAEKDLKEWKDVQSRNAMGGGLDCLEDIYDALSEGQFRQQGVVRYGHGTSYYLRLQARTSEIIANYGALSMTRPNLIEILRRDKPDLVAALEKVVKDMVKAVK